MDVQSVDLGDWKRIIRTFDVEGTWEGDAVAGPTSTVRGKVVGLSGTRGLVRMSKMVAATNEVSIGGAGVLGGEVRVLVV